MDALLHRPFPCPSLRVREGCGSDSHGRGTTTSPMGIRYPIPIRRGGLEGFYSSISAESERVGKGRWTLCSIDPFPSCPSLRGNCRIRRGGLEGFTSSISAERGQAKGSMDALLHRPFHGRGTTTSPMGTDIRYRYVGVAWLLLLHLGGRGAGKGSMDACSIDPPSRREGCGGTKPRPWERWIPILGVAPSTLSLPKSASAAPSTLSLPKSASAGG